MRGKKHIFLHILFSLLSFSSFLLSISWAQDFEISQYDVKINIKDSSLFEVEETLLVNFSQFKHGIMRKIPYVYQRSEEIKAEGPYKVSQKDLNDYEIEIYDIKVIIPFNMFSLEKSSPDLLIKIGDPNKLEKGPVTYKFKYKVFGAINFYSQHEEFYWNLIGLDWDVPILKSSFSVFLPKDFDWKENNNFVYTGPQGSKNSLVDLDKDSQWIHGESHTILKPHEGMTIGIKFPKGYFSTFPAFEYSYLKTRFFILNHIFYLIPLLTLFALIYIHSKYGENSFLITMRAIYRPPSNITAAEAGIIVDDEIDNRDLLSLLYSFAADGFIEIEHVKSEGLGILKKEDYLFKKKKELPETAKKFERSFFNGLFFDSSITSLNSLNDHFKTHFKTHVEATRRHLLLATDYAYEKKTRWMKTLPPTLALLIIGIFIEIEGNGHILNEILASSILYSAILPILISLLMMFIFKYVFRPRKSSEGRKIYEEILNFKLFIERVDKKRIQRLMEKDPTYFDKTISYAVAFGLADKWIAKFEGLLKSNPSWFVDSNGESSGTFNIMIFSSSFNHSLSSLGSNFNATLNSSTGGGGRGFGGGGGSSGGGSGGGGGSSW